MRSRFSASDSVTAGSAEIDWMITVTEPLPDCPSVQAGWERIATQSNWGAWRSESKMRGSNVTTAIVPPATEPLQAGDEYVVRIGGLMKIHCRVLEASPSDATTGEGEIMIFDAMGTFLGGLVRARFRFTIFRSEDGVVVARAQERIDSLSFLVPRKEILENEHRHTFRDLNMSFVSPKR
ncbi:MAG: hypothetical protein PF508_13550 [Spirochaeta sp.]|nr:hypothetical protein [Spirochaeta sp.]